MCISFTPLRKRKWKETYEAFLETVWKMNNNKKKKPFGCLKSTFTKVLIKLL